MWPAQRPTETAAVAPAVAHIRYQKAESPAEARSQGSELWDKYPYLNSKAWVGAPRLEAAEAMGIEESCFPMWAALRSGRSHGM